MEPKYVPSLVESRLYQMWESGGYFKPNTQSSGQPFTIILPPPNASGKMHMGNVLMVAIEDLLIRYHRMKGDPTLWVPGTDHAGIETQTTFERELKKQGKSRFDFDRDTLYHLIWDYVQENKNLILSQLRDMGASVDWSRLKFTLDPDVIQTVYSTFIKMEKEGLIYRGDYLVNYSFKHGTTFSDAEIHYVDRQDPLYFIKYRFMDDPLNFIEVATVRPELVMIDTHLAVNPKDKKHLSLIGKKVLNPLTDKTMDIISDPFVDPKFGTGIVKLTPAHDKSDYQVAASRKDLNIPIINVIDWNGRLNSLAGSYQGKTIKEARAEAVIELTQKNLLDASKTKTDYLHQVPVDTRSDDYIENLILPNWFIRVDDQTKSLKSAAYLAVKSGDIKIFPKWREATYLRWMENLHDWAISRQNIWGIRIPVWYSVSANPDLLVSFIDRNRELHHAPIKALLQTFSLEEIETGLQKVLAPPTATYVVSVLRPDGQYLPETDTFDTWFSSGQWPLLTLGFPNSPDFNTFYPTNVLETGWEIVTRWVSRMVMLGLYLTDKMPFKNVYLHGHVRALDGKKMSKSLGNTVNPDEYLKEFGADALRMGLISGTANGKDFNFPRDKVIAYRNFANKLWNIGRFIFINLQTISLEFYHPNLVGLNKNDKALIKKLESLTKKVELNLDKFRFAQAADLIYQFAWHDVADVYLESLKDRLKNNDQAALSTLHYVFLTLLKLLHPFMPFVTEELWILLPHQESTPLITTPWPTSQVKRTSKQS